MAVRAFGASVTLLLSLPVTVGEHVDDRTCAHHDMTTLKILSWNIDARVEFRAERVASACTIIQSLDPDVICLQEVLSSTYQEIRQRLVAGRYEDSGFVHGSSSTGLQTVVMVRKDMAPWFETISLSGRMRRTCIVARCQPPYPTVASCHLESFNHNVERRLVQISEIDKSLQQDPRTVLCGDMNFIQPRETFPPPWVDVGSNEYTYDALLNTSIRDNFRTRLDRLYIKGIAICNSRLIGTEPLKQIFPSDHFGIYAEVTL
ncbi:Endonuclease/exonuclease/phosphatase [Powellomyces hirtus]|nr:Endonuclease/exonuclease/phosphatase [Powellomyces hirtus]